MKPEAPISRIPATIGAWSQKILLIKRPAIIDIWSQRVLLLNSLAVIVARHQTRTPLVGISSCFTTIMASLTGSSLPFWSTWPAILVMDWTLFNLSFNVVVMVVIEVSPFSKIPGTTYSECTSRYVVMHSIWMKNKLWKTKFKTKFTLKRLYLEIILHFRLNID